MPLASDRTPSAPAAAADRTATLVHLIGILDDGWDGLGRRARERLAASGLVIGAARTLALVAPRLAADVVLRNMDGALVRVPEWVRAAHADGVVVAVLATGDPLCHGIGGFLIGRLGAQHVVVHPAPSTLQLAFARLKKPWHDVVITSCHAADAGEWTPGAPPAHGLYELVRAVAEHPQVAAFTSPDNGPDRIARALLAAGFDADARISVAARLCRPDEALWADLTLHEAAVRRFPEPNVVVIERAPLDGDHASPHFAQSATGHDRRAQPRGGDESSTPDTRTTAQRETHQSPARPTDIATARSAHHETGGAAGHEPPSDSVRERARGYDGQPGTARFLPGHSPVFGFDDDLYAQRQPERGLITKLEARAVSLAKLALTPHSIVWDIGAGSGSVGLEASRIARCGHVWAIEKNAADAANARENARRFAATNYTLVEGRAPAGLERWPDPDAIFIGGSGGELAELIALGLARLRAGGRLVMNFVTLENLATATTTLAAHGARWDVTQLSAARSQPILDMHRLAAHNPVWIVCARPADASSIPPTRTSSRP